MRRATRLRQTDRRRAHPVRHSWRPARNYEFSLPHPAIGLAETRSARAAVRGSHGGAVRAEVRAPIGRGKAARSYRAGPGSPEDVGAWAAL